MKTNKTLKDKSSCSKPYLREGNAVHSLQYALSFLLHADEKWFFFTTVKKRVYVYEDEGVALRALKSKRFITKGSMFNGKIGIWRVVENVVAKRNSRSHPKGTVLLAPQSVTAAVYRAMILDKSSVLLEAMEMVKTKRMSSRIAAKHYGIGRMMLQRCLKNHVRREQA
ncbi:hypothetical protein H257_06145 [Aphanomyces astaci]|uniref:HTH psq-type domain-containing protein n=1 Tax=Aphanomyces astaci TaxID=112090 RepID=W4GMP9_APHAT|nr:hypothetical protein H257_06145 [Aphanomyces astaci]ETV80621.1 hypothetical protein H257_06145 [Aphanomyces astaci]|eukprot:XP_009829568.1 hypothetical protein H257_06145 [Aphanomyces astaci]